MYRNFVFLLVLFIFASGCSAQPTAAPATAPTVTPEATETHARTATVTIRPVQEITRSPASAALPPQADPRQRGTLTTPTLTVTPRPTRTLTPTVTIDTTITAIVTDLVATVTPETTSFRSPDGKWRVDLLRYDCAQIVPGEWYESAYDLLQIVHLSDGVTEPFADQLQYCGGVGAYGLGGITWSPNSRYFYFTYEAYGVPDGVQLGWRPSISRYDTRENQVEGAGRLFSPDSKKLAGLRWRSDEGCVPEAVVVQTLDGEILASYPVSGEEGKCPFFTFTWAVDSTELVYLEAPCFMSGCVSTLYHVDLASVERKVLLEDHSPAFLEVGWPEPDLLTLTDENYKNWHYRISTGELTEQ